MPINKTICVSALSLVILLASPFQAFGLTQEEASDACQAVKARLMRDHRYNLTREGDRTHIYMIMADQKLPYSLSLGWIQFRPKIKKAEDPAPEKEKTDDKSQFEQAFKKQADLLVTKDELIATDESGLILPQPGAKPLQKDYNEANYHNLLGCDMLSDGKVNDALKEFQVAAKLDATCAKYQNNIGALLALKGEYAQGVKSIDLAIQKDPKYLQAITNRALLHLAIGQPDMALKDAKYALTLDPKYFPAKIAQVRATLEKGDKGSIESALSEAAILKENNPGDWQSLILVADCYFAAKQYKEAKEVCRRIQQLSANDIDNILKLAVCFEKLGDLDNAIKEARKGTVAAPDDPRPHLILGRFLLANRDDKAAALQFERTMDLERACSPHVKLEAMNSWLKILIRENKTERAEELAYKWAKTNDKDPKCQYNLGWILSMNAQKKKEAIEAYQKTLKLDPALVAVHYNLGLLMIESGDVRNGLAQLRAFVKIAPKDSDTPHAKELIEKFSKSL
ncbi:MAG: tetratricopeptide repeat protein [Candidatus Melainabacteria bacterium]|nr:tetratricopeptide repeat protein [Candidatus Melainabacteria bacterium]